MFKVDFPTSSFEVRFSTPAPAEFCPQYDFSRLDSLSQIQLQDVLHKKAAFWYKILLKPFQSHLKSVQIPLNPILCIFLRLTVEDKRLLWEKRAYCQSQSSALPLVLSSAPCWQWTCLPEIYGLLRQWVCLGHLDALGLLHAQ